MSGAVAAHASYNGSGTQGLAVTNKISDAGQGDVISVFWNETDTNRQLLYGSSTLEIPTSGSGKNASWGGSQIFTVNNDIDCLGDMYLSVTVDMNTPSTTAPLTPESSFMLEKGGWYYSQNDNASSATSPMVKEAAAQGVTFPSIPMGNNPSNVFSGYSIDTDGVFITKHANVQPESSGNRVDFLELGNDLGLAASIDQYITNKGSSSGAVQESSYGGGYFKKLAAGETAVAKGFKGEFTFNTRPPNGWAWVGDTKMQITSFNSRDLIEFVHYYNDKTHLIYGRDELMAGEVAALADIHPENVGRPEGGIHMTMTDATETFKWYQQLLITANNRTITGTSSPSKGTDATSTGLIAAGTVELVADHGSALSATQEKPRWTSLFREVPDGAATMIPQAGTISSGWGGSSLKSKVKFPLAKIIKRVEFQVGTQIWQTLEYNDLLSINATEIPESSYNRLGLQTTGYVKGDGSRCSPGEPDWAPGKKYQAFIPLPVLTQSLGPQLENFTQNSEDGYLMAAAPHQNVKIKIHYANFNDIWDASSKVKAFPAYKGAVHDKDKNPIGTGTYISNSAHDWAPNATLATKLYGQHMIMCNEEREQMKNMPNGIPKRLKMTQNVNTVFPQKIYPDQPIIVDLDHFSLYGSHLIISADFPGRGAYGQTSVPSLKYAELKLNSSSFSGQLDGQLLKGITNKSLGLYANDFSIDKQQLDSGMGYYVFPLAARAFGGSSVPLNRFDNIRLSLTFTHPDITSAGYTVDQGTINVTCVGETTGLYKDGAASLAMY